MNDTQTQIERLIELAIVQRSELKQLISELPQLREHLNAEIERTFEEAEPQIRTELEEFCRARATDEHAKTGAALAAVVVVVAWGLSLRLRGRWLPAQYLVRVLCVVQALALLYFWFAPMPFPHQLLSHAVDLLDAGYLLMLSIPVLMALGYYPLQISWQAKVVHTLLILMFFGIMVPQQALVHLLILQHLSVVFMPVLYLCFGALFDMMVFVALYAWAASTAPLSATH